MTSTIAARTRWHVQCMTALSADTTPSLLVVFDDARYVFGGCPENFTRSAVQDRISLRKLRNMFLCSVTDLQAASGLGGLLLSIGEKEGSSLDIYGPEGTDHFLASMRFHTRREKLRVKLHQVERPLAGPSSGEEAPVYEDANIRVWATSVLPESAQSATSGTGSKRPSSSDGSASRKNGRRSASPMPTSAAATEVPAPDGGPALAQQEAEPELDWFGRGVRPAQLEGSHASRWRGMVVSDMFRGGRGYIPQPDPSGRHLYSPAWTHAPLPPYTSAPFAISYLVVGPAVRGQFLPKEAQAQGVKPGPDFAKLIAGQPIDLPDGKQLDLAKCFTAGAPAAAFAVVSCPTPGHIAPLLAGNPLKSLPASASLKVIYHNLGPGVLENEAYINWLAFLPADTRHIVSAPGYSPNRMSFSSAAILQLRLSRIDCDIFKLPHYELEPQRRLVDISGQLSRVEVLGMGDLVSMNGTTPAGTITRARDFDFLPDSPLAQVAEAKLKDRSENDKTRSKEVWTEYLELAEAAKESVRAARVARVDKPALPGGDIKVTALGTGSAMPSKYRNVSSTVLELPSGATILLDAGEGTYGQLARRYGTDYPRLLGSIRLIFISHMHADHHSGLASVLVERVKAQRRGDKLYIACQPQVQLYIRDLARLHDLGLDSSTSPVVFIDNHVLLPEKRRDASLSELYDALDLKKLETVMVEHRTKAFGVVIEGREGWSIVYSGDTQPCQALVRAGQNATLLIHEATIEDEMPEMARMKGHSTFAEAIQVAQDMRAKTCLLTHFSQRYPKFPPLSDREDDENSLQVAVAFDLMSLRISEMWQFKHYVKALQVLFSEMEGDDGTDADGGASLQAGPAAETESNGKSNGTEGGAGGGKKAKGKQPKSQLQDPAVNTAGAAASGEAGQKQQQQKQKQKKGKAQQQL